jgi:endonuclease III related protein
MSENLPEIVLKPSRGRPRTIIDGQRLNGIFNSIFHMLLACYGPQHWWPAQEPFEVIVGAILTQTTAWTNVEKAIANLRKAGKLSPASIRRLTDVELAGLIHSCGYYNVKANRLKSFVVWFGSNYDDDLDKLFAGDIAQLRSELLEINGVGEETADSIMLYAGNKPVFVIDAYTRRIIDRLGLTPADQSYTGYKKLFNENLPADPALFNEYHALLVRLGKERCHKTPVCQGCCLNPGSSAVPAPESQWYPCRVL